MKIIEEFKKENKYPCQVILRKKTSEKKNLRENLGLKKSDCTGSSHLFFYKGT